MTIREEIQRLEVGEIVELYEVDATALGGEIYRFHGYGTEGVITWQGLEYSPWPIKASGFAMTGQGRMPTPKLSMGNVGGFITALVVFFNDLVGSTVIRRRTLGKYLDGRPDADPTEEFPPETWYIEQKAGEDSEQVVFELSSALNFQGVQLPRRQIIANNCQWRYRGAECGYTGPPVADEYDIITTDAAKDKCGKRVGSCQIRVAAMPEWDGEIPYGGFAAAGLTR